MELPLVEFEMARPTMRTNQGKGIAMFEEIKNRKAGLGYVWIRSESGSTYLCPAADASGMSSASDEKLRAIGVDESCNPHND